MEEKRPEISLLKAEEKLFKSKKITLFGEIDDTITDCVIKKLLGYDKNTKEVELWIKSNGGSVENGFALIDIIRTRPYVIKTVGVGFISSMAVPILAAGTKGHRFIGPNTSIMLHELVWGAQGNLQEMKVKADQSVMLQEKYCSLLQEMTKQDKNYWKGLVKPEETWITPRQAVKTGLIDKIALL